MYRASKTNMAAQCKFLSERNIIMVKLVSPPPSIVFMTAVMAFNNEWLILFCFCRVQQIEEIVASFSPCKNLLTKIVKKIHGSLLC